jgi:bifunctional polynucleotide phosphatase/kinase
MTGMFDLVNNLYKSKGYEIDMEKSVYVGDAAGRLAGVGRRKDHGDTDYKLALNVGLRFVTPEVCLLSYYPSTSTTAIIEIFGQVIKLWS